MRIIRFVFFVFLLSSVAIAESKRLPTGKFIEPAGRSMNVGNMPLNAILSPEKDRLVLILSGFLQQGVQVLDPQSGEVTQTLEQPGAFLGLVFSPDGKTLYASGGMEDSIYRYTWQDHKAVANGTLPMVAEKKKGESKSYPAGLAISKDGSWLYIAENIGGNLAVMEIATGKIVQRLKTGPMPYAVVMGKDQSVYVSSWAGNVVSRFRPAGKGVLKPAGTVEIGMRTSAMVLNADGSRLLAASAGNDKISVIDTKTMTVRGMLSSAAPAGPSQGSAPNAMLFSSDWKRLFVAEADNNAVAVFELTSRTAGVPTNHKANTMIGRIPTAWYPLALTSNAGSIYVLNGKGNGTRANPTATHGAVYINTPNEYTLGQLRGTVTSFQENIAPAKLAELTQQTTSLNGWDHPRTEFKYPFKHVIYVIKENRTFDQMLGDLSEGDADESLVFFPRKVSPNHHALAERFGIFDRFFVNAEVSSQGHPWSTAAYSNEYIEKTVHSAYSDRRPELEEELEEEASEGVSGYLWDAAIRRGVKVRNYGEGVIQEKDGTFHCQRETVAPFTNLQYPGYDMEIPDQKRMDVWLEEFEIHQRDKSMPALEIVFLPRDHTAGTRAGLCTPQACAADNDLALGRMIDALSHSEYWKDTVVFVVEDDSQSGPDHVDSHRSVLLVLSAYNKGGVIHRFVNTTDVLATIEEILGLESLSQFDYFGRPMRDEVFAETPNLQPYTALTPEQSLTEVNPATEESKQSMLLKLDEPDASDDALFNMILWKAIKGNIPYPGIRQMTTLDMQREM